jgi:hypothetical protein
MTKWATFAVNETTPRLGAHSGVSQLLAPRPVEPSSRPKLRALDAWSTTLAVPASGIAVLGFTTSVALE